MMKKNIAFTLIILILLIFLLNNVMAEVVDVNYNFYNDSIKSVEDITSSSIKLKLSTIVDASCKYNGSPGVSYDYMDGNFDISAGTLHEKTFTGLGDGIYIFYIKCDTTSLNLSGEPAEMKLILRVNSLVTAQIVLEDTPPLKAGRTELTLLTSKVVSNPPSLSYSFDGIVYNDLPLYGSEKIWKGHLIIPKSLKDTLVSFKFSANDLEGRQGTVITSGNVFLIDTVKPLMISEFEAIGYVGEIELEWHLPEEDDILEYNVYRSTSPNVGYTDFYTTIDDQEATSYTDESVDKGKTYYYKISSVDEAGNEGDLSKEVYATVLKENISEQFSGLAPHLVGKVENFIVEVESAISDLDSVESSFNSRVENEKKLFSDLGLENELKFSRAELVALKKDADTFKLQDLTELELENKLDSLRLKLGVIKKKIPENLVISDEESQEESFNEENVREALLKINSSMPEKIISKSVEETKKFVSEAGIRIESNYYLVEIIYFDGSRKDMSVVVRNVLGEVERSESTLFVEIISDSLIDDSSEINFRVGDYSLAESDAFSFETDTKKIVYVINRELGISRLSDSKFVFVKLYMSSEENSGSSITGFFLAGMDTLEYGGIGLGILILVLLMVYFIFLKKSKLSPRAKEFSENVDRLVESIEKLKLGEAKNIYGELKEKYSLLEEKDKRFFHKDLISFHEKIIALEIEKGIEELKNNRDETLFKRIDSLYSKLSDKSKKRIEESFNKVKQDFMEK